MKRDRKPVSAIVASLVSETAAGERLELWEFGRVTFAADSFTVSPSLRRLKEVPDGTQGESTNDRRC